MRTRNVWHMVTAALLLADAVSAFLILPAAFAGTDPAVEMISAVTIAVLIAALGIAIVVRPFAYGLMAGGGIAILGIILCAGFVALTYLLSLGDLTNRGTDPGLSAMLAMGMLLQLLLWLAAWKARNVPLGRPSRPVSLAREPCWSVVSWPDSLQEPLVRFSFELPHGMTNHRN